MISSIAIGVLRTQIQKKKFDICAELISFSNELLIDLEYAVTPLPNLLQKCIKNHKLLFFISTDNLLKKESADSILNDEENEAISTFIYSLGKSDINSQIKLINGFIEYISFIQKKYLNDYEKYKKINLSFSLFFGLMICLVFA